MSNPDGTGNKPITTSGKRDQNQRSPDHENEGLVSSKKPNLEMGSMDDVIVDRISVAIGSYMQSTAFKDMFSNLFRQFAQDLMTELSKPLQAELETIRKENEVLRNSISEVKESYAKQATALDEIDQSRRSRNMIIANDWEEKRFESPFLIVRNFCNSILRCDITDPDMEECYRIGKKLSTGDLTNDDVMADATPSSGAYSRPIFVKFRFSSTKTKIVEALRAAKKRLGGSGAVGDTSLKKVFFNDDLTPLCRNLLTELKVKKKRKSIVDFWVKDGIIFAKTETGKCKIMCYDDIMML